jgi:putative ABC transport system substrate-binding protein
MDRRAWLRGFLGLLAAPRAGAQPAGKVYRVGIVLTYETAFSPETNRLDKALVEGLRERGYVIGQNLVIEFRSAEGRSERVAELLAELVQLKVDLLVGETTPKTQLAMKATRTIPIVFCTAADPVGDGLVTSLARPGGNVTGLTTSATELSAKRLELIKEVVPGLSRVAVLTHTTYPQARRALEATQVGARVLGLQIQPIFVQEAGELATAFAAMARDRAGGLIVLPHPLYFRTRRQIADLAAGQRLPVISEYREYSEVGALLSYGPSLPDQYRRAAGYIDRILKGAKPADLPIEQPTKFELVINLKTAKALGLTIPPSVLARADEVIE